MHLPRPRVFTVLHISLCLMFCSTIFSRDSIASIEPTEIPRASDYVIESFWHYSLGLGYLTANPTISATLGATTTSFQSNYTSYGPIGSISHGVSLDGSGIFEVGARLGYYLGSAAKQTVTVVNEGAATVTTTTTLEKRDHITTEAFVGFGYVMTYLPVRWYAHFVLQNMKVGTATDFTSGTSGFRVGLGYYLDLSKSINIEYFSMSPTFSGQRYPVTVTSINLAFLNPMSYPKEPWQKKFQKSSAE